MIDWDFKKSARLQELFCSPEKYSESQIANIMSEEFGEVFSRDAVHNKITRLNLRELLDKPVTNIMPYYNKYRDIIQSEGPVPKEFEVGDNQLVINLLKDRLKILHLGDLHIPFQDDEQVQIAVNRNKAADAVVAVELSDCYSISRFNKNLSIPFEVEVDNIVRYYEYLSDTFPLIFVVAGNHEKRITKRFTTGVPQSLLFLVKKNMLELLARPFSNIVVLDLPIVQINDAIFTHAEYFSKVDLKAGVNASNFILEWKRTLGLDDYRLVVQSHTHMLGATYRFGGEVKIMESGCLCRIPDYAVVNFYSKPQVNGYVTVVQENGQTNFDLTREYAFGTQLYIPEWNPVGV